MNCGCKISLHGTACRSHGQQQRPGCTPGHQAQRIRRSRSRDFDPGVAVRVLSASYPTTTERCFPSNTCLGSPLAFVRRRLAGGQIVPPTEDQSKMLSAGNWESSRLIRIASGADNRRLGASPLEPNHQVANDCGIQQKYGSSWKRRPMPELIDLKRQQ
jgi:hypothetical protein